MKRIFSYLFCRLARDSSGFSLLEMLVATALSSVILLMVYSANKSIMTSIYDLTGVSEFYENVNLAINRIDSDIAFCHFDKNNPRTLFIGSNQEGTRRNGTINLISINHYEGEMSLSPKTSQALSDVHEVGYYLKSMEGPGDLNVLMRRDDIFCDDNPEEGGSSDILLENVVDVRFEFWRRNSWLDAWDSRQIKQLPDAVRTTITVRNYRGNDEVFTFITFINS